MNISIASDSFFPKNTNSGPIKLKKCQLERSFHYAAFSRCTKSYGFSAPEKAGGGQGPPKLAPSPRNIYKPGNTHYQSRAKRSLCFNFENHYSARGSVSGQLHRMASGLCKQCCSGKLSDSRYKCSDGHRHCSNACMNSHGCVKWCFTQTKSPGTDNAGVSLM